MQSNIGQSYTKKIEKVAKNVSIKNTFLEKILIWMFFT